MGRAISLMQSTVRCFFNIPVFLLCMLIAWSYYVVVFIIWLFVVPYHSSTRFLTPFRTSTVPFCDICFLIKPDRTHHCSNCEKCVPKMDHHCPWINNCVGHHNHKYFLLFLFHAIFYCLCSFVSTLGFFIDFVHVKSNRLRSERDACVFPFCDLFGIRDRLAPVAVVSAQFIAQEQFDPGYVLHVHYEFANPLPVMLPKEHFRSPNFRNPALHGTFNLGCKANFIQVFGRRSSLWCYQTCCIPYENKFSQFSYTLLLSV
ncbi:unnamed protein product [Echinostoma caproni]|uniref:Palmitoyltransferase n=1 Tax=Echinostoma caproni TaxID=27848 RepID=A0A183AHS9_9TREM|nr:unnamed protein product [Echinostoma caproni]